MYISNIKLWNFRKYGSSADIDLDIPNLNLDLKPGLNALIGANDAGKTAIIDAIKIVLKTHSHEWISINEVDFFGEAKELRIEIVCKGMSDDEAKNFTEWLGWEGAGDDATPYLKLIYHVTRTDERITPSEVRAGVDPIGKTMTAEAKDYLKATYLKPLRDAKSELVAKRNSRLSQIFRGHDAFKGKSKTHDLVRKFEELNKEIKAYFEGKNVDGTLHQDQKGKLLKSKVDEFVQAFCGDDELSDIKASEGDLISILERLEIAILDRINPGLGTLNRLFMSTELVHISKDPWSGIRVGLIEELEAHLSPQAQMQVVEKLQSEEDIQLILSTHSPNLASKVRLENLILCIDDKAFPMGSTYTKLKPEDYIFLEKFLDVTKSNLFFAKGVILVEGWAEEILVPSLAKRLGYDLTKYGIAVINVGNTAYLRYSKIFLRQNSERIGIPIAVVTDVDVPHYIREPKLDQDGKTVKADGHTVYTTAKIAQGVTTSTAAKLSAIQTSVDEADVKSFIAPNWTLEYSLYSSEKLGEKFQAATKSIHTGTNWDNFEPALANLLLNKGLNKAEIAYRMANALDAEESLIDIGDSDSVSYLAQAIKYSCRVASN